MFRKHWKKKTFLAPTLWFWNWKLKVNLWKWFDSLPWGTSKFKWSICVTSRFYRKLFLQVVSTVIVKSNNHCSHFQITNKNYETVFKDQFFFLKFTWKSNRNSDVCCGCLICYTNAVLSSIIYIQVEIPLYKLRFLYILLSVFKWWTEHTENSANLCRDHQKSKNCISLSIVFASTKNRNNIMNIY